MTLEELQKQLQRAHPRLEFDIRHRVLWVQAVPREPNTVSVATGSITVDPPFAKLTGSACLSTDLQAAKRELRLAGKVIDALLDARASLGLDDGLGFPLPPA